LENFVDPCVGGVSGDLLLLDATGALTGVALYWSYEKMLRRLEGRINSVVGVTGAISAVRRRLFQTLPQGTILDDVYWPLQVVLQGYRVIHDRRAVAYDHLPPKTRDEFRRKVRTLSGNFQLMTRLHAVLLPWRNPVCLQFVSHKVFRLLVPWALQVLLVTNALLTGPRYRFALALQTTMYGLGLLGLIPALGAQSRLASAASSFIALNSAAWLAFWVWITGRAGQSWNKTSYRQSSLSGAATRQERRRSVLPNNRGSTIPKVEARPYGSQEKVSH
jgi:poly-beta-1,6-N-acetyl-D-glucosamine synthase